MTDGRGSFARPPSSLGGAAPITLALALALAAGCSTRASQTSDSGSSLLDGKPLAPDSGPLGAWTFQPEDTGQAQAAVALKLDSLSGDEATLRVMGRGMAKLQGVAFRLAFDPQQVKVLASELGGAWVTSSAKLVSRFATRAEGALWAGIGHSGSASIAAVGEVELARVKVQLSGAGPVKLAFAAKRNLALDPSLKGLSVEWLAGSFVRGKAP